jgi:hypothetical protein
MSARQPDLFLAEPQAELFDERPETKYSADPDKVRAKLHKLLAEARAAKSMPWDERTLKLHQTVFPQMANWLPEGEAAQLRFEFAAELERLLAA